VRDDCIIIALGLPEVRVVREEEMAREIVVEVIYRAESAVCPGCGQQTPKVHSTRLQRKRDRRLWDKPVFLLLRKRRFRCMDCRKVFTEPDPVCGARRRSSQRFRRQLGHEAIEQPVRHVARREGVGETLVRRCVTEEGRRLLQAPDRPPSARILGLDEFSIRKGQVYDTAVVDLEHRRVMGVVTGHGQKEVASFFTAMSQPEQAQVVVMDMHEPFRPRANVVVDKFHVLLHVHRALDQVRTSLQPLKGRKGELFRARYLLLTAVERLTPEKRTWLLELLDRYPLLRRAWELSRHVGTASGIKAPAERRQSREVGKSLGSGGERTRPRAFPKALPYAAQLAARDPQLLRLPLHQWLPGRQEQSHQGHQASGLWLPQHYQLQATHSPDQP
jgi:transposase